MTTTTAPIPILKPGLYKTASGEPFGFSVQMLEAIADAYDPAVFHTPLVAGTPQHDDPAGGWIKQLTYIDGALRATPEMLDPVFGEAITTGKHQGVLGSIYLPDNPNNPKPGSHYLRHVGFRGVAVPVVKGVCRSTASFASSFKCLAIDFGSDAVLMARLGPLNEISQLRAYSARHCLTTVEAYLRMNDAVLTELDEVRFYAKGKGISFIEACILKGI